MNYYSLRYTNTKHKENDPPGGAFRQKELRTTSIEPLTSTIVQPNEVSQVCVHFIRTSAPKGKKTLPEKGKAEAFGQVESTNHRSHQSERTTATQ